MLAWWENKPTQLGGRRRRLGINMPKIDKKTEKKFEVLTNLLDEGSNKLFVATHGGNFNFYTTKEKYNTAEEQKDWKHMDNLTVKLPENVYVMKFTQLNACGIANNINDIIDLFQNPKVWLDIPEKSSTTSRYANIPFEKWEVVGNQIDDMSIAPTKKTYMPSLSEFGRLYLPGDNVYNSKLSFQIKKEAEDWEFDIFDINKRRDPNNTYKSDEDGVLYSEALYDYYWKGIGKNYDASTETYSEFYEQEIDENSILFPDTSMKRLLEYIKNVNKKKPVLVVIYNCAPYLQGYTNNENGWFYPDMNLKDFKTVENKRLKLHDGIGFDRQMKYIDYLDNKYPKRPLYTPGRGNTTITKMAVEKMYKNSSFVEDDYVKSDAYYKTLKSNSQPPSEPEEGKASLVVGNASLVVGNATLVAEPELELEQLELEPEPEGGLCNIL